MSISFGRIFKVPLTAPIDKTFEDKNLKALTEASASKHMGCGVVVDEVDRTAFVSVNNAHVNAIKKTLSKAGVPFEILSSRLWKKMYESWRDR